MIKHRRIVRVEKDRDVERAVDDFVADGAPRLLVRDGKPVAVILSPGDYAELRGEAVEDIWSTNDPDRARRALAAGVGALAGVGRDQLLRDLRAQRGQESSG